VWKGWTDLDWRAPPPRPHEVERSHDRLRFVPSTVDSPAAHTLVDTFRSILTNGGAQLAAFAVEDADETAHWFLSRNRFDEYGFVEQLLRSDAVAAALPALVPVDADPVQDLFQESSPLLLDGLLAGALTWGGAYGNFDGSSADAKKLALQVCSELMGTRYEDHRVDVSYLSWSAWFQAVVWDKTWIVTDNRHARVTLLCTTDTD
jgi:hypothetical protein